ncbi:MAG: AbrB/MazE/SpoVT family DNA-binding domain-containing protein [Myxococcales bacterium]|nr:AbrB/MazE/SpoVT family DNA-binding domain-containing protein [Myxococcales bacterium]
MIRLTIDRFGRVIIPKQVRRRHGWGPGTALSLYDEDGPAIRLESVPPSEDPLGLVTRDGHLVFDCEWLAPLDQDPVRDILEESRRERETR